jgi:hypothetical protein
MRRPSRRLLGAGERDEGFLERVAAARREQLLGRPWATTTPRAMMRISSQSAETSCMTWLEKRTHLPSSLRRRITSRRFRVVMTSRPLVGSSSTTLGGSCTRMRAMATFMRSPCEKPSVRRSRIAPRSSHSASRAIEARISAAGMPRSSP